MPISLW